LAAISAALLHELGHLVSARLCSIPLRELKLGIFGAAIVTKDSLCSYKKEIILALAGPITNILTAVILLLFFDSENEILSYFISASFFLGILNLLPVYEFDGGRVIFSAIALCFSPKTALKVLKILSFIIIFSLWCLSVYLLLRLSASISLFVFSLALFAKIFLSQKDNLY
ncbi:MAG: site-2 protease family protein, partial [Clostridia bacterium]|nr:site-2 protease family protein [Clostridia bacterium]